jgi:hypothetical protein
MVMNRPPGRRLEFLTLLSGDLAACGAHAASEQSIQRSFGIVP